MIAHSFSLGDLSHDSPVDIAYNDKAVDLTHHSLLTYNGVKEVGHLQGCQILRTMTWQRREEIVGLWMNEHNEEVYFCSSYGTSDAMLTLHASSNSLVAITQFMEWFKPFLTMNESSSAEVDIDFWVNTPNGPRRITRSLDVPTWQSIEENYTMEVRSEMDRIFELIGNQAAGRILIWHGPPGTGKTYAIRSLMSNLHESIEFHYIIDPDDFFGHHPSYMVDVLLSGAGGSKTRVFILEDTGELLRADAGERQTQGLSRLLNFADGLIGQGLDIRVMITTNEKISSLHEAVTRHGRCLSNVEFAPLSPNEANEWLEHKGSKHRVTKKTTLSELYALIGTYHQNRDQEEFRAGVYV